MKSGTCGTVKNKGIRICYHCGKELGKRFEIVESRGQKRLYCRYMMCMRDENGNLGYYQNGILGRVK